MNTALPAEVKTPSTYKEVSCTSTYKIYATLPILIIYTVGSFFLNTGGTLWVINGAEKTLFDIGTWFETLPPMTAEFLMVACVAGILYRDRQTHGLILPPLSFFALTASEAVFLGLAVLLATPFLTCTFFFLFPERNDAAGILLEPLNLFNAVHAFGSGFYEEVLYRFLLLGGGLLLLRRLHVPGGFARVAVIVAASILPAWVHYTGHFEAMFTTHSFLYRSYAEMFFCAIYLRRGFATVVWSHAAYDIAAHVLHI